ncbi:MAG: C69 family dipeptidase [Bacteroidota bacterium]|nr:C69 family dipeptidase [Bacteroidota bacterium]
MKTKFTFILILIIISFYSLNAQDKSDWKGGVPEGCTTITAGKTATVDGSVITSHTDDSHRTRSWLDFVPATTHKKGETVAMYKRTATDSLITPAYKHTVIGKIPQVKKTYAYLNTAYPCINEHQLAIGESTFGGRDELQSDKGLIDCQRLAQLLVERCTTAREAIKTAGELTKKYGWNDAGECLTIADPNEVWHFEITGSGKGKTGAVWAAQRVPDDHIAVNANASTIKEIDLDKPDYFMASENIYSIAEENGWWNKGEEFVFCNVYAPESRKSVAARRREWRVFDLLAPSLKLNPTSENYPFSVKPDEKVDVQAVINVFQDYYEGTPYDMTRTKTVTDDNGKQIISPLANPFLPYDQLEVDNIRGGWFHISDDGHSEFLGERTIARWYTMYGTIIQCRDWLPDDTGGLVWLAMDNIATSIYVPIYCGAADIAQQYKVHGRETGFTMESAWWIFNRLGTLTAQRWGDMRHDVRGVWDPIQTDYFKNQAEFEKKAVSIKNPEKRKEFLTKYSKSEGERIMKEAVKLGDHLWTKYDEKF